MVRERWKGWRQPAATPAYCLDDCLDQSACGKGLAQTGNSHLAQDCRVIESSHENDRKCESGFSQSTRQLETRHLTRLNINNQAIRQSRNEFTARSGPE